MFEQAAKECYSFGVEGVTRYVDPLETLRKVRSAARAPLDGLVDKVRLFANEDHLTEVQREEAYQAESRLVFAVSKGFGLPEFEPATGKGFQRAELIELWNDFQGWLQKKNGSTEN